MIDQSTYLDSVCPYECSRSVLRHAVSATNELNLLSGAGLQGEGFLYPGTADDARYGLSRFERAEGRGRVLHALRTERGVTVDECDALVRAHRLLAPHAVWLIDQANEAETTNDAARKGECGLFLGARSPLSTQLWRAFYSYARLVLRLGHFDAFVDDDIVAATVHTSSEGACASGSSRTCVWWSEMELDDEEYRRHPSNSRAQNPKQY